MKAADQLIEDTAGIKRLIANRDYGTNRIRAALRRQNTFPVIRGCKNRKRAIRYDKLARNYQSAVMLAEAVAFWL